MPKILFLLALFLLASSCSKARNIQYDLLIMNGTIVDGTGDYAFEADILVDQGVIIQIGEIDPLDISTARVIDASGLIVSPGFIDTHSHGNPLETPRFDNFLSMGVTTISLGQDGRSPETNNLSAWMDEVEELGTGPNILHFTGHGTLRMMVEAPQEYDPDPGLIDKMQQIMAASMNDGSFGMTTGLEYDSGRFATMVELVALAEPVAVHHGLVMSHLRSEDDDNIEESVEELLDQGRKSGAAIHVSHIKIVYTNEPQRVEDVLQLLEEGRNDGLRVTADVYPYTASYTGIGIVFPDWARAPDDFDDAADNRRGELEEYLRNRIDMRNGPEATLIGTEPWTGMTLAEVAEFLDKPFEKVLIDDIGPRGVSAAYFVMNEDVMRQFLLDPHVMVSSDGSPAMRHPRGYGSFAKIIRQYVNEEQLLPLEEAIYKMSGLPAATLGLDNQNYTENPRGIIRKGFAADLLIFDPLNVTDNATFADPHQYASGFNWVIVNGVPVVEEGSLNKETPGGVIRRKVMNRSNGD